MKPDSIYKVRDCQFLEYPNGEIFANSGDYVCLDYGQDVIRAMMHGQKHRALRATEAELKEGVKLKEWEATWVNHCEKLGYKVPRDTEFKLGRAVTKSRAKAKPKDEEDAGPSDDSAES